MFLIVELTLLYSVAAESQAGVIFIEAIQRVNESRQLHEGLQPYSRF
jgi:hypothetical protein